MVLQGKASRRGPNGGLCYSPAVSSFVVPLAGRDPIGSRLDEALDLLSRHRGRVSAGRLRGLASPAMAAGGRGGAPAQDAHPPRDRREAPRLPLGRPRRGSAGLGVPAPAVRAGARAAVPGALHARRAKRLRRGHRLHRGQGVGGRRDGGAPDRGRADRAPDHRGRGQRRDGADQRVHAHRGPKRRRRPGRAQRPDAGRGAQALDRRGGTGPVPDRRAPGSPARPTGGSPPCGSA